MKTYHFLKRNHFFSIPGRTWAKIELNASVDVFTFIANFKHCDLKDLILKFLHSYNQATISYKISETNSNFCVK